MSWNGTLFLPLLFPPVAMLSLSNRDPVGQKPHPYLEKGGGELRNILKGMAAKIKISFHGFLGFNKFIFVFVVQYKSRKVKEVKEDIF
jgi:hypothetical protein